MSIVKAFLEDSPEFVMQSIYIVKYSENKEQTDLVFFSIFTGALSFCLAVHHALTAKASLVDAKQAMKVIRRKIEASQNFDLEISDSIDYIDNDGFVIPRQSSLLTPNSTLKVK